MEPLRNLLLAGLGAISYSQDKLKTSINALVEKGELSRDQGEQVLNEWIKKGAEEKDEIAAKVSTEMTKVLNKLSLVTRDEYEELKQRLDALESKLGSE